MSKGLDRALARHTDALTAHDEAAHAAVASAPQVAADPESTPPGALQLPPAPLPLWSREDG